MAARRPVRGHESVETAKPGVAFQPAGHDRTIAAVRLAPSQWRVIPEHARKQLIASLKAEGFRYVALDITPEATDG
ncbi:MAG: hypothetical protein HY701_09695 [Gemmatimonadetes bacterium]|nr:hypothetical protein [Gemmatimonadota bacterium]